MQKPAETGFPIAEIIRQRWSPVAFSSRPVPPAVLGSMFEAARWAASSYGDQPWSFCVATQEQPTEFASLLGCLMEANQAWCRHAPVLILSCARKTMTRNEKPNHYALHDTGMATAQLMLQGLEHGVYSHPMGGFDHAKAREAVSLPDSHEPVAMIAVGYPVENFDQAPADLQQRDRGARVRKPLTDVAFTGKWGRYAGPFS